MKALLIYQDDSTKWVTIPEHHRYGAYFERVDEPVVTSAYMMIPPRSAMRVREFLWKMNIIRFDHVLFDIFEEV
jgi:hypothetical protein